MFTNNELRQASYNFLSAAILFVQARKNAFYSLAKEFARSRRTEVYLTAESQENMLPFVKRTCRALDWHVSTDIIAYEQLWQGPYVRWAVAQADNVEAMGKWLALSEQERMSEFSLQMANKQAQAAFADFEQKEEARYALYRIVERTSTAAGWLENLSPEVPFVWCLIIAAIIHMCLLTPGLWIEAIGAGVGVILPFVAAWLYCILNRMRERAEKMLEKTGWTGRGVLYDCSELPLQRVQLCYRPEQKIGHQPDDRIYLPHEEMAANESEDELELMMSEDDDDDQGNADECRPDAQESCSVEEDEHSWSAPEVISGLGLLNEYLDEDEEDEDEDK